MQARNLPFLLALAALPLVPTAAAAATDACERVAVVVITENDKGPVVEDITTTGGCHYRGLFVRVACTETDPRMCVYAGAGVSA